MEFFCFHRDRVGSIDLRDELLEDHWSYMDRYAAEMIARGPTSAGDGDTPTGSVRIVDLADPAAARAFAFDEPNYQAGVYREAAHIATSCPTFMTARERHLGRGRERGQAGQECQSDSSHPFCLPAEPAVEGTESAG